MEMFRTFSSQTDGYCDGHDWHWIVSTEPSCQCGAVAVRVSVEPPKREQ